MSTYEILIFTDSLNRGWKTKTIGAYRIATELRKNGFNVKVIDYFSNWLKEIPSLIKLLDRYISANTLFIGFSGVFFSNKKTLNDKVENFYDYYNERYHLTEWPIDNSKMDIILNLIRKRYPNIKFVYGGLNSTNKDHVLSNQVDFIIKGYADSTIIDLANHLKYNASLKYNKKNKSKILDYDVKGDNFIFPTSTVEFIDNDDILPGEILPLETARGCLFKCSFCNHPLLGRGKDNPPYIKSNESLIYELKNNYEKFNVSKYMIVDDTFNETSEKIRRLIDIRNKSGVNIEFYSYIRLDLICKFPEQISLLKELGIKSAFLGIESLNWESAKAIGKGIHPEKVKDTLYKIKEDWKDQTSLYGSFIIGLPYDTRENLEDWVPWVLDENSPLDSFEFGGLGLGWSENNSDISKYPEKYGYTKYPDNSWKNNYWDSHQARKYAHEIMNNSWNNGRLKIGAWLLMGLENYGYSFNILKNTPIKYVDFDFLNKKNNQNWNRYKQLLLK